MNEIIIKTDWWSFGATIFSGLITAASTILAVIYTNRKTREQLKEQQIRFDSDKENDFKREKFVVIKPMLLSCTCIDLLERIILQNNFNRVLLLSGKDGFEFFENSEIANKDRYRMIQIKNETKNNIYNIQVTTNTIVINLETNNTLSYNTYNGISFLRGNESLILRLIDKKQFDFIISLRKEKIPVALRFESKIEYSTEARQRISYSFIIEIKEDSQIDYIEDGVNSVIDERKNLTIHLNPFKNLQDYANNLDRVGYAIQKTANIMQSNNTNMNNKMQ